MRGRNGHDEDPVRITNRTVSDKEDPMGAVLVSSQPGLATRLCRFAGTSCARQDSNPATRGLEVRRFVYENAGSAACSSESSVKQARSSYPRIRVECCFLRQPLGDGSLFAPRCRSLARPETQEWVASRKRRGLLALVSRVVELRIRRRGRTADVQDAAVSGAPPSRLQLLVK